MSGDESPIVDRLADPESLLGMLQRGRGKGYLLAQEKPPEEVWPLLLECLINDSRLDKQLEEREEYYASLIVTTEMDLNPLATDLRANDVRNSDCDCCLGLILSTLGCLADEWEHQEAMEILRDYVPYGRKWKRVIQILSDLEMPSALEGVAEALVHRVSSDPRIHAKFVRTVKDNWKWYCQQDEEYRKDSSLLLPICEPWKTLCLRNPGLANLFAELGIAYDQAPSPPEKTPEADIARLSVEEMFTSVDKSNRVRFGRILREKVSIENEEFLLQHVSSDDRYSVMLAFRGLGQIGTPRAFHAVKSYIEASENADRSVRVQAFLAIEAMPADLTLDTARAWFRSGQHHLHIPASGILEQHATRDDVPMLIEALRTPETVQCEDFRLSGTLEALALFNGIGPIPELETVFCDVAHCFQRHRAAMAMEVTAPAHFQQHYAFECLWDCHDETRELGCDTASLTVPGVLERLRELAGNEDEDDNVRKAAQERLEGF